MSLFIDTLTDEKGEAYEYGHCYQDYDDGSESGCGMEYAWYPDSQRLEHWHDAVGSVSTFEPWTEADKEWLEKVHALHHPPDVKEEA